MGCSFAIDTDAHAPGQLEWLGRGCRNAVAAGVPLGRVVNRASADDLVAWAAAHEEAA
jgi:putative hydrolase